MQNIIQNLLSIHQKTGLCYCGKTHSLRGNRRDFLALTSASASIISAPAWAQVDVGAASRMRHLIPAEQLENAAAQQYNQLIREAQNAGILAHSEDPQLLRLKNIARRLIPFTQSWNERAKNWNWGVVLIRSKEINAFCMPGGKIAFYTGILEQLKLSNDEAAMIMGHEMAHALREHSREQMAKNAATQIGISLGSQLLGLGEVGNMAAQMGGKLLSLKFSRNDERDADLVGLEIAARAGYSPSAAVSLWQKMTQATGGGGIGFLSTHPTGPDRIVELQANVPKVENLYQRALQSFKIPQ